MYEKLQMEIDETTIKAIDTKSDVERTVLVKKLDRLLAKREIFMLSTKIGEL